MDPAQPDKKVLNDIYGDHPHCFLGSGPAHDFHHIFGRGNEFGAKVESPSRVLFSSVYNIAPLGRMPHDTCSIKNDPNMRLALFKHAKRMVDNAILSGHYEITQTDREFLVFMELQLSKD